MLMKELSYLTKARLDIRFAISLLNWLMHKSQLYFDASLIVLVYLYYYPILDL